MGDERAHRGGCLPLSEALAGSADEFDPAYLHRWTIDLEAGRVREDTLDDLAIEFPRIDDRFGGLQNRYGYAVTNAGSIGERTMQVVKYDLREGGREVHDFGRDRMPSEMSFVPAADDAGEEAGWLVGYVYDQARNASDLVVLDASSIAAPPVATIRLPVRVPFGFHGGWIPDPA